MRERYRDYAVLVAVCAALTLPNLGAISYGPNNPSWTKLNETTFAQVLADRFCITPEEVRLVTGDTAIVPARTRSSSVSSSCESSATRT